MIELIGKKTSVRTRLYVFALLFSIVPLTTFYLLSTLNFFVNQWLLLTLFFSIIVFDSLIIVVFIKDRSKVLMEFARVAQKIATGDWSQKVKVEGYGELGELAQSFNAMVKSLQENKHQTDQQIKQQTKQVVAQSQFLEDQRKAILNVLEDIDESRIKAERERDKQEKILSSIGDGVFVVDEDKKIILFNKASQQISGFSEEEVLGKKYNQVLKFVFEDERKGNNNQFIEKVFKTGEVKSMTNHTLLIQKDGNKVAVADSAAPIKNKSNKTISCVVVFRDVSKEREIDRMKTEFLSVAAHQLRTPLGSMRWNIEMLLEENEKSVSKNARKILEQIYVSHQQLLKIVNDLLDATRIDQGRVPDKPQSDELSTEIEDVLNEFEPLIKKKRLKINFDSKKGCPKVKLDRPRWRSVVSNILSNAIKYNRNGGRVDITCKKLKNFVQFEFTDTGIGIPEKDRFKIFDKFFRAENAIKSETEGTGLGLYVVKKYVEAWGGKVNFTSNKGKGTLFIIKIPLKPKSKSLKENLAEKT